MAEYYFKSPEKTDWTSQNEQQIWFEKFKTSGMQQNKNIELTNKQPVEGLKFSNFRDFLKATVYSYFERQIKQSSITTAAKSSHSITTTTTITAKNLPEIKFTYQQELQLFKAFDSKNDHLLDRDEFAYMCRNWLEKTFRRACALVVVDVQNDFIDGSLALINGPAKQDGAEVVPIINGILEECNFDVVVYTQDWHPIDHISFHDNLHLRKYSMITTKETMLPKQQIKGQCILKAGSNTEQQDSINLAKQKPLANGNERDNCCYRFKFKKLATQVNVFDTVLFDQGRIEQKLWPIHCIQNSWGAELHPKLKVVPKSVRILKGTSSSVDSYSAFYDNMRLNETGLRQELISRNISDVYFCGLALEYCVAASAIDSAKVGFTTFVIEDACRGLDYQEICKRKEEMLEHGILIVKTNTINNYLSQVNSGQIELKDMLLMKNICFKRALSLSSIEDST